MTSIDMPDLLTVIYVLVDDWYQDYGVQLLKGKRGAKPEFSDSEVMTLLVAHDYIPYPSETQYVEWMRANHPKLFPQLLTQSQFNRRARGLRLLLEAFRRYIVTWLGVRAEMDFLLDSKPVPVMGYTRSKAHSQFAGSADYGVCSSRKTKYFGYKLVTLNTLEGVPAVCELVPANLDERAAAEAVLFQAAHCDIVGDKGFIGEAWQADIDAATGNRIYTPKRANQHKQNPPEFDRWLNSLRQRCGNGLRERFMSFRIPVAISNAYWLRRWSVCPPA